MLYSVPTLNEYNFYKINEQMRHSIITNKIVACVQRPFKKKKSKEVKSVAAYIKR